MGPKARVGNWAGRSVRAEQWGRLLGTAALVAGGLGLVSAAGARFATHGPLASIATFLMLALAIRNVVHWHAWQTYEPGWDSAETWPRWFDWGVFRRAALVPLTLFATWAALRTRGWAGPVGPPLTASALAILCAVGYSVDIFFRDLDARHPLSGFPLTKAFVAFASYFLLVWELLYLLLQSFRPIDPALASHDALLRYVLAACAVPTALLLIVDKFFVQRHRRLTAFALVLAAGVLAVLGPVYWFSRWLCDPAVRVTIEPILLSSAGSEVVVGLSLSLSIIPIATLLPILAVTYDDERSTWDRDWLRRIYLRLLRGHLLLVAIVRQHVVLFALGLPLSIILPLGPANAWFGPTGGAPLYPFPFHNLGPWLGTGTASAWFALMFNGLYLLDDTYAKSYQYGLHRALMGLQKHLLVLGYGDLGRRLVEQLFTERILSCSTLLEHLVYSQNVLLPDGRLGKLYTRLATIEQDLRLLRFSTSSPDRETIATADVSDAVRALGFPENQAPRPGTIQSERSRRPPLVDYLVPAVVGDATRDDSQNLAKVNAAAFVVCALGAGPKGDPSQDSSHLVFRRLQKLAYARTEPIPAAIAIHTSTLVPHMTAKALTQELPVHYLFPVHLAGLNAGSALYAAWAKKAYEGNTLAGNPAVLICGRGKRLFYTIDTFLQSLDEKEFAHVARTPGSVVVLGADDDFRAASLELDHSTTGTFAKWARPITEDLGNLKVRRLVFSRFVSRMPGPLADKPRRLDVAFVFADACNYELLREVLVALGPGIVLVSEHSAEAQLRVVQAIIDNVSRLLSARPQASTSSPPFLLVTCETSSRHLRKNLAGALEYYNALTRPCRAPSSGFFPTSAMFRSKRSLEFRGDPMVEVLDSSVQRLIGLLRAYEHASAASGRASCRRLPVQFDLCGVDRAGSLGAVLASLGGFATAYRIPPGAAGERPAVASLQNSRFVTQSYGRFIIRGSLRLQEDPGETAPDGGIGRVGSTFGGRLGKQPPVRFDGIDSIADLFIGDRPTAGIAQAYEKAKRDRFSCSASAEIRGRYVGQVDNCCGMPHCPVEGFHKLLCTSETELAEDVSAMIENGDDREDHCLRLCQRFFASGDGGPAQSTPNTGFADVRIDCERGSTIGTFAGAISALVFRVLEEVPPGGRRSRLPVCNLTYLSDYECHEFKYGVTTLYGTLVEPAHGNSAGPRVMAPNFVIRKVVIKPVRSHDYERWRAYGKHLRDWLNQLADGADRGGAAPKFVLKNTRDPIREDGRGFRIIVVREDLLDEAY